MNCNTFANNGPCFHVVNSISTYQNHQYIDLSYDLNKDTIMWPGGENFQLCMNCTTREPTVATVLDTNNVIHNDEPRNDRNKALPSNLISSSNTCSINKHDSNYFYAAGVFTCSEHGGTHVDAPFHFNEFGNTVDLLPLCDLICDGRVIDISKNCSNNDNVGINYILSSDDILEHEKEYGILEPHSIVIIRTGWSMYYKTGSLQYIGYEESLHGPYNPNVSKLCFPGIGEEAAHLLVQRKVVAVGIDTGR